MSDEAILPETPKPRAVQQRQETQERIAVLTEHLDTLQTELRETPLGSDARRKLRRRMADAQDDLSDAREHDAQLTIAVKEEAEEAVFQIRLRNWHTSVAAFDNLQTKAAEVDFLASTLPTLIVQITRGAREVATGVIDLAHVIDEPAALSASYMVDIVMGHLCVAGVLPDDALPDRYRNAAEFKQSNGTLVPLSPKDAVGRGGARAAVAALRDAVAARRPVSPAEKARVQAEHDAREARLNSEWNATQTERQEAEHYVPPAVV